MPARRGPPASPPKLPPIVPRPRRAQRRAGAHRLVAGAPIVVPPGADPMIAVSAERLRAGLAEQTGLTLPIEPHLRLEDLGPRVELALDATISRKAAAPLRGDAYRIEAGRDRIRITGAGPPGLRYGIETLLQIVDTRGRVPACRIDDGPDLELRGVMLDVSRGKVPSEASLRELIDLCAALKLNVLMLYTEHTFRFRRHPEIGRDDSPLDADTMRRLDAYAAERFVDLIPTLQSLGHMAHILGLERYAQLAETEMAWTIAPGEPGSQALLADLYDEYLPCFRSRFFNANCDEPWDLGRGRSKARAEALGPGGLYLEHVRRIRDLAAVHGKRTMIWGDVVHAHPDRIPEIERDLILLDWWYEADFDYERVAVFAERGLDFLVCPGTSSWNSLFPRVQNSVENISRWAAAGRRHGARGLINTDWGDHGHYNLQGNSLFAYAWGAQESWSGAAPAADFDRAFSRLVFGDASGEVARLYRALGAAHDAGFAIFNGSPLQYLFFDDIERGYFISATKPKRLAALERRLESLRPRLEAASARVTREQRGLDELLYALDASLFALRKARSGLEYNAWRKQPSAWRAPQRRSLAKRLSRLADEQRELAGQLRRLWLARSRQSNLDVTLRRIGRATRALRAAARRLEANRPSSPPVPEPITGQGALREVRASLGQAAR
jgi:HAMP domain-containing protein